MVTAYHQFDSPSLLYFYEQQTRARGLLHHLFFGGFFLSAGVDCGAQVSDAVCNCLACFLSLQVFFWGLEAALAVADLLMS